MTSIIQMSEKKRLCLRYNLSLVYNPVFRKIPQRLNNKGINNADSPIAGEFPPDRAEEATRTSRETVLQLK